MAKPFPRLRPQFQFHKGSINTSVCIFNMSYCHSFNSIKVRLIQQYNGVTTSYKQFQFHKGSINTLFVIVAPTHHATFQFHKGSINTEDAVSALSYYNRFNSIKVRLIPHGHHALAPSHVFQFHKGSINTTNI